MNVSTSENSRPDPAGYLASWIRHSLNTLKNPRQMIPTLILGGFWLILALLQSMGIRPLPVRLLSFLTFAGGGLDGTLAGAAGGILGKVVVAAFLNATLIPLLRREIPFATGGIRGFFSSLTGLGIRAVSPLFLGAGAALLLYGFMNSTQSLEGSMVGIVSAVVLVRSLGSRQGFLWGLVFQLAGALSRGKTPSWQSVNRLLGGMVLGFSLAVGLSATGLRLALILGLVFLLASLGVLLAGRRKEAVNA